MLKNLLASLSILILFVSCTPKQEKITLKIMSYNIRHGEGLDELQDLSRAAEIIKAVAPDLCGLQEIDHLASRTDSTDQTAYLANSTAMTGWFGKFMDFQGGAYGMATLTKLPIRSTNVLALPDGLYEPRTSIVHEVEIAENEHLAFANVHFDWISNEEGSARRLLQAQRLVQYIDSLGTAAIITGDFNCTPDSPTMKFFEEAGFTFVVKGEDSLSFQGAEKVEIDHLIYRASAELNIKVVDVKLLTEPIVSDHRPLVVALEITTN